VADVTPDGLVNEPGFAPVELGGLDRLDGLNEGFDAGLLNDGRGRDGFGDDILLGGEERRGGEERLGFGAELLMPLGAIMSSSRQLD
jgi:hypothetical protein